MTNTIVHGFQRIIRILAGIIAELVGHMLRVAKRASRSAERWLLGRKKARYGLAVTRMLLGLVGAGTVVANWSTRYYTYGSGSAWNGQHLWPTSQFGTFWPTQYFRRIAEQDLVFSLSMVGLFVVSVLVMLGWHTRIVLPLFLLGYVSFVQTNAILTDGSDNFIRITLIYLLFADPSARLSLDARRRAKSRRSVLRWSTWRARLHPYDTLFHNVAILVLVVHLSFAYMGGALYKANGAAWASGHAIYDPLHVARFSSWPEIADVVTAWGPTVVAVSWGTVLLQMMFLPLLMNRVTRTITLIAVFAMHIGIGFLMGLPFFSLVMIAVDAVLVRDRTWRAVGRGIRDRWRASSSHAVEDPQPVKPQSGRRSTAVPTPVSPVDADREPIVLTSDAVR